jgi:hypothetical protein
MKSKNCERKTSAAVSRRHLKATTAADAQHGLHDAGRFLMTENNSVKEL